MLAVKTLLVDFDGTACLQDAAMLRGSLEEMLAPFVAWAEARDLPLVLASDGFAFYIRPILDHARLGHLEVVTNELVVSVRRAEGDQEGSRTASVRVLSTTPQVGSDRTLTGPSEEPTSGYALDHPNGHPECIGCGTCKMLAARRLRERHGPVALVARIDTVPGPVGGDRCPGWRSS